MSKKSWTHYTVRRVADIAAREAGDGWKVVFAGRVPEWTREGWCVAFRRGDVTRVYEWPLDQPCTEEYAARHLAAVVELLRGDAS